MPEMDGYTARNMIHARQGNEGPAIVALTANTDDVSNADRIFYTIAMCVR